MVVSSCATHKISVRPYNLGIVIDNIWVGVSNQTNGMFITYSVVLILRILQITYGRLDTSAGFMYCTSLYQLVTAAFQFAVPIAFADDPERYIFCPTLKRAIQSKWI